MDSQTPSPSHGKARKPTIRDVAAAAGVSRGTVSRVLNGGHWVSPAAREAVEAAIASTGYYANHHARSLATGRADSVAFLLTEPQQLLFDDPTFPLLLRGATEALSQQRKTLVLLVASTDEERENVSQFVGAGHVDGVLLISPHERDPLLESLVESGIPTVAAGVPIGFQDRLTTVSIDEVESARTATSHLAELGRKRIAMIAGPADTPGGKYRVVGFRDTLGTDFDPTLVEVGDYSRQSGADAMARLLDKSPDIDAVFAASDRMAVGAIATAQKRGYSVPGDIAVVGFDDSGMAATVEPPLTTIRQPFGEISATMVGLLLDLIAGREAASVVLPTELVRRETA